MRTSDLKLDPRNANKGTIRGAKVLAESIKRYGAGRSIVLDKHGVVLCGNHLVEQAQAAGLNNVVVVKSDGSKLVAVQRTDLDASESKARELAIADNRTAELGLEWNPDELASAADLDLKPFFTESELADASGQEPEAEPDPSDEWGGMPDFDVRDLNHRQILIHFRDDKSVEAFAKLLKQKITPKTKFLWYPKDDRVDQQSQGYVAK